jgi:hypothetical protein
MIAWFTDGPVNNLHLWGRVNSGRSPDRPVKRKPRIPDLKGMRGEESNRKEPRTS